MNGAKNTADVACTTSIVSKHFREVHGGNLSSLAVIGIKRVHKTRRGGVLDP